MELMLQKIRDDLVGHVDKDTQRLLSEPEHWVQGDIDHRVRKETGMVGGVFGVNINGYSEKKLCGDIRYKLNLALGMQGVLNTDHGRQAMAAVSALKPLPGCSALRSTGLH